MRIEMKIPILAVAKGRPRFTKSGRVYTPAKTVAFENTLKAYYIKHGVKMFPVMPTYLEVIFYLPIPKKKPKYHAPITRPDLDNLIKGVKDSLNGIAWKDDSQVTVSKQEKRFAEDAPYIYLLAQTIEATL